jgi:hypothetical protein
VPGPGSRPLANRDSRRAQTRPQRFQIRNVIPGQCGHQRPSQSPLSSQISTFKRIRADLVLARGVRGPPRIPQPPPWNHGSRSLVPWSSRTCRATASALSKCPPAASRPKFSHVGIVDVSESYDRARSACDVEVWIRAPALARLLAPKFENF